MSDEELIRACAESADGAAWSEFVRRFHRPISLSVIRTCYQWGQAPRQLVDDLVQETYLKLCADNCRQLLQFAVQHPGEVQGYIKRTAINVVHDYFKSSHSQKRGSGQAQESLAEIDPKAESHSLGGPAAMERQVLLQQIDACFGSCPAGSDQERDRLIFWFHYRQGMSAKAISALPGIGLTPKGVESAILRLTRMVRERLVTVPDDSEEENRGE
jgi:RNA polymerase sigma-70 factor (ECF subfamily)